MSHGSNISIEFAQASIRKFANQEVARSSKPEEQIVVGHRFDLALIKTMISEIDKLNDSGQDIDSIRIYLGINNRDNQNMAEEYDVILVPTHSHGEDYHNIYKLQNKEDALLTLLGKSTPCPNVCQRNKLFCSEPV